MASLGLAFLWTPLEKSLKKQGIGAKLTSEWQHCCPQEMIERRSGAPLVGEYKIVKITIVIFFFLSWRYIKKERHYFANKVYLAKAMAFPVVMYGCESWTIKKAEHWIIDAFELWCWRRLLRVPWTARRSKQSILKEIRPGCSMEGLMLKLKLQYSGEELTHCKRPWCWEGLGAGGEGDAEDEMAGWHHWLNGHEFE